MGKGNAQLHKLFLALAQSAYLCIGLFFQANARKQSIYPLTTFDVDPKTGAFTRMVRVETAIPLLRNMGLPFLVGKARFLAVCTHKVGTHASGYCKEPNAFSDRAILAEVAYLERNPGIQARPEAPRTTQNIISTIAV